MKTQQVVNIPRRLAFDFHGATKTPTIYNGDYPGNAQALAHMAREEVVAREMVLRWNVYPNMALAIQDTLAKLETNVLQRYPGDLEAGDLLDVIRDAHKILAAALSVAGGK